MRFKLSEKGIFWKDGIEDAKTEVQSRCKEYSKCKGASG